MLAEVEALERYVDKIGLDFDLLHFRISYTFVCVACATAHMQCVHSWAARLHNDNTIMILSTGDQFNARVRILRRYNSMLQVLSVGSMVLPVLLSQMEEQSAPDDESGGGGGECALSAIEMDRVRDAMLGHDANCTFHNISLGSVLG